MRRHPVYRRYDMDIQIKYRSGTDLVVYQIDRTRLLTGFIPGDLYQITLAIRVTTQLNPRPQLTVVCQQNMSSRGVAHPGGSGQVSGYRFPIQTFRPPCHQTQKSLDRTCLGGPFMTICFNFPQELLPCGCSGRANNGLTPPRD